MKDRNAQMREYRRASRLTPRGRLGYVLAVARKRAEKAGVPFDITVDWVMERWTEQDGRCKLTGIEFDLKTSDRFRVNPYAPSVDRVDPRGGYTQANVELVCTCVNLAINEFGRDTFFEWVSRLDIVQRRRSTS